MPSRHATMSNRKSLSSITACCLCALIVAGQGVVHAQERAVVQDEHWAMAPFLGTGAYSFEDEETVWVFEFSPRWTLRDPAADGSPARRAGIEFLLPSTVGLSQFDLDDLGGTLDPDNVATLSVVPGVYATLDLDERWTLLGTANLGIGARLDGAESALIHRLGLRARYRVGTETRGWKLIAALEHFGYNTDRDRSGRILPLSLTAEYEHALAKVAAQLVVHVTATRYLDEISVSEIGELGASITQDLEFGLAYRPAEHLRLWRLSWERVGLAYRRGEGDGDDAGFDGIRLYFRSVFHE